MATLYDISFPVIIKVLRTTVSVLTKGEEYANQNGISTKELLTARIYDDMLPLTTQVLILVKLSRQAIKTLTGATPAEVQFEDKPLEELFTLLDDTLKDLSAVEKRSVDEMEGTDVNFPMGAKTMKSTAPDYIRGFIVPNMYFHLSITYALLRKQGVPLGKRDYLSEFAQNLVEV
ncbi:hypothetical protein JX265_013328 [Neoarthrinium moseri]|uniref:DUF1993 domain-containing protein n=1 Tax=Neoarthrinium moseri TaxID=1658444 RepID=A0A9P9W8T9_9PEZI|nr:uncharacterized protein JN550_005214 [Neoarthrinium moseri]KAI1843446.1 hypothetical protein JX266_010443 [Neoarthrinium moseri]KAI1850848.1 hypothetical protein JX265_013328 [Neoarthrinium moseri]KAI1870286.1 hypothetical protein JN550_005214 [Neoarthrinium moseri]